MKQAKSIWRCCVAALAIGIVFTGCGKSSMPDSIPSPTATPAPTPVPVQTVRFSASGDNLIHGSIYLQARTPSGYDFAPLYKNIRYFYAAYDLNFINQETLVNDELPASTYPVFSTPGALGKAAYDAGFRLFSGSNNHSYDKGAVGIDATLRFWDAMPEDSLYFGFYGRDTEESLLEIPVYEKNGITFACLAYTDMTNGLPTPGGASARVVYTYEKDLIEAQLQKARQLADVVLVSVHWGIEDSHTVSDAQRTLAQRFADLGADLIIGTHPHVIQPVETITAADGRQVPCAYSLGNFVSAQSRPDELIGYILTCTFTKEDDAPCRISDLQAVPTITSYGHAYSNIRVWLLKDYPNEELLRHGVRTEYPYFDRDYIASVYREHLNPALLPENWLGAA